LPITTVFKENSSMNLAYLLGAVNKVREENKLRVHNRREGAIYCIKNEQVK